MRMADQRCMRRIGLAFIQQSFQPARRPVEKEGFDSVGHVLFFTTEGTEEHGRTIPVRLYSQCYVFECEELSNAGSSWWGLLHLPMHEIVPLQKYLRFTSLRNCQGHLWTPKARFCQG